MSNNCLQKKIEISGTRQVVSQYGVSNEYEREVEKAYVELLRHLELAAFYGQRGTTTSRSMGGIPYFVTTNATASFGVLTQKGLEDKAQAAWEYGGKPSLLVCNAWVQRKIRDMYVGHYRTMKDDARGGIIVDKILLPPVGEVDVLVDRFCPTGTVLLIDPSKVGYVPIREFFDEPLAKTSDSESGQVIGEYSLVLQNEKAHAKITGISTTA